LQKIQRVESEITLRAGTKVILSESLRSDGIHPRMYNNAPLRSLRAQHFNNLIVRKFFNKIDGK